MKRSVGKTIPLNLTYEIATEILNKNKYERQRDINQLYVKLLARLHDQDELDGRAIYLVFGEVKKKRVLINGNYTCHVVRLTKKPLEVNCSYVNCIDEEDLAELYSKFDTHRKRNQLDAMRAIGILTDLTAGQGRSLSRAIRVMLAGFKNLRQQIKVNLSLLEIAKRSENWLMESLTYFYQVKSVNIPKPNKAQRNLKLGVMSGECVSLGLVTNRYCPDKAEIFWDKVSTGELLTNDSPMKIMREYMMSEDFKILNHGEKMNVLISYWNLYLGGKVERGKIAGVPEKFEI